METFEAENWVELVRILKGLVSKNKFPDDTEQGVVRMAERMLAQWDKRQEERYR